MPSQSKSESSSQPERDPRRPSDRPHALNGFVDPNKQDEKRDSSPANKAPHRHHLPVYNHNGHKVSTGIQPDGESGRRGFSPKRFVRICWRSSSTLSKWTNVLWPFTIVALVLHFGLPGMNLWIFITAYIGMVPAANLVGFAGQELARKLPKVVGVLLETTLGSVVEIILFMVLVSGPASNVPVIRAAILGSILANMLLCLGMCFFVGGIFHPEQTFHKAISEVGSNLMLVAGSKLQPAPPLQHNHQTDPILFLLQWA